MQGTKNATIHPKNLTDGLAKSIKILLEMYQHASNMAVIFWYWYFSSISSRKVSGQSFF